MFDLIEPHKCKNASTTWRFFVSHKSSILEKKPVSPFVIPTLPNLPLMGDMGVRDGLKERSWSGLVWDGILLMNYLKISNEELRNH